MPLSRYVVKRLLRRASIARERAYVRRNAFRFNPFPVYADPSYRALRRPRLSSTVQRRMIRYATKGYGFGFRNF